MHARQSMLTPFALMVLAVVALQPAIASAGTQDSETSGREVFERNCAMCHGRDASGMMGMHPSLRGAVERLTREGVQLTIRNGRATQPPMPAFGDRLTDQDIADVIAYLDSLPVGPRNFGPRNDGMGGRRDRMDGGMMQGGIVMLLATLLVLALVVLAVAAIVWVIHQGSGGRSVSAPGSPARDELDRRYATGELSRDEYLQRRRDLET
ncbi:MAG: c-type cytochrome [Actinobacteria bacterium]|nr:c-type cytochrome [Actinomycetota bacterium]